MRAQHHRVDNTSRATAKLAELQARGLCAPPPEPSAVALTVIDRQAVDAASVRTRAQVVGVVVPAYLSLEELLVKSGVNTLQEVALSLPPMPLHVSCPQPTNGKEQQRRNEGLCAATQHPFTDTGGSGTLPALEGAGLTTETAEVQIAAGTAALAAMAAMRGVSARIVQEESAVSAPRPPKPPPPGFATAGTAALRTDANVPCDSCAPEFLDPAAPQSTSVPTSAAAAADLTVSATQQTQIPLLTPSRFSVSSSSPAGSGAAAASGGTGKAGAAGAYAVVVGAQKRSCPTPTPTPPPQGPTAANGPSLASASNTATSKGATLPPPPHTAPHAPLLPGGPTGVRAMGATWPGLHIEPAAAAGAYQANPYAVNTQGYPQPQNYSSYGVVGSAAFYEQQRHHHPMYFQLAHTQDAVPIAYQAGLMLSQARQVWQQSPQLSAPRQQHPTQQLQHHQLEEPRQAPPGGQEARRAGQQSQQPCVVLAQPPPPAWPSHPPVQPQSLAPVGAVFGPVRFEAVTSVLRRTLTALYSRTPDIFREVYGFDLSWWIITRGKPLGEDDLLSILPFRDYVVVVVRKYTGFTQHVNGGRKLCQLAANPVLSALLGRPVCGNALVLRLRMDFADPLAASSRSANAAGSSGLAGLEACGSGGGGSGGGGDPVDHVCGVSLTAAGLRNVLLETETVAWHVEQYKAFLEDMDDKLLAEAQVGWVARLPRTPLDERGMPNIPEALKAAAAATGLAPVVLAQALGALTISGGDHCCDGKGGEGAYVVGSREGRCDGSKPLSNGCARLGDGSHRGESKGVPEALVPLLRCVRCSSPWRHPAAGSGSRTSGACPFGHVWRSLDPESDGDSPLPVFTAARPGVLTTSTGASTSARGPCSAGGRTPVQSVRQLLPEPCGALVARLSVRWHWHRSTNLKLLVAAALDERLVEMEATEAAQAAARALGMPATREGEAVDAVDGCGSHGDELSGDESQEAELAPSGSVPEAAKEDDGKSDDGGEDEDEEDGEEKYRLAAQMLRHEAWPYYLSFCKGPECRQCHSGHEVRLAAAVRRLLGRGVGGVRHWDGSGLALSTISGSTSCLGATGALATANSVGQRLGFEVLAKYDEDVPSRHNVTTERHTAVVVGNKNMNRKAANGSSMGSKSVVVQQQPTAHTASGANRQLAPGAAVPSLSPVHNAPTELAPAAGSVDVVKMSWADEAEAAEALETAAADMMDTAHRPRQLLGKSHVLPSRTAFTKLPTNERSSYTVLEPHSCTAAPSPPVGWRYDTRPLPALPDHLDDYDGGGSIEEPPQSPAGMAAAAIVHETAPAGDVGQVVSVPDRAAVSASMASKSRNGVYVPPHLRAVAGDGAAEGWVLPPQEEEAERKAEVAEDLDAAAMRTEHGRVKDRAGGPYASASLPVPTPSLLQPPQGPPPLLLQPAPLSEPLQGQLGALEGAFWPPSAGLSAFMPGPNQHPYDQMQQGPQLQCPLPQPSQLLNPLSSSLQTSSAAVATSPWGGTPPHLQSTGSYATFLQDDAPGPCGERPPDNTVVGEPEDDLGALLSLLVPSAAAGSGTAGAELYSGAQAADDIPHGGYGVAVGGNMAEATTRGSYAVQPQQASSAVQPPQHASYPNNNPYADPYGNPYSHTSGSGAFAPVVYSYSMPLQPPLGHHFPAMLPAQPQQQQQQQPPQLFFAPGGLGAAVQPPPAAPPFSPASFMSQQHLTPHPPGGLWPGQLPPPPPPPLGPPIGLSSAFGDQYTPPHYPMRSSNAVGDDWDPLHV